MTITVVVKRSVQLTTTQVELLRFLAGEIPTPPLGTRPGTYDVLETNGLIKRGGRRGGGKRLKRGAGRRTYRSTVTGEDVLRQLGVEAGD